MNRSDWIALLAAIGTFLGLIPAFHQFVTAGKSKKHIPKDTASQPAAGATVEAPQPRNLSANEKALGCTSMAVLLFVIELVIYSWIAHWFNVNMDPKLMPFTWLVGFACLFILPGLLILIAFLHFSSNFSD